MMMKMLQIASRTYITKTQWLFHCNFKIKVPERYGEAFLDSCFQLLKAIDYTYNSFQRGSYFSQINENAGDWVAIDHQCHYMLKNLLLISSFTNGAYDISCMPLLRLWGFYRTENFRIPNHRQIREALSKVNYSSIELEKERVRIAKGQEITTGSFIKSFATDRLIDFLKSEGVSDAIINAGGSTIFGINDSSHPSWKVNIPSAKDTIAPHQINISNQCFNLSARTNNHLLIEGKEYGHILNSNTGYPASTLQTGIWSTDAFLGDALSTAIFCLEQHRLTETIVQLKSSFEFDYFRMEADGTKTTNACF